VAGGLSADKKKALVSFIETLPVSACAKLLAGVERDRLAGGPLPHDLLIEALRKRLASEADVGFPVRAPSPQRVFFEPYEDLFINTRSQRKTPGRIQRASLDPIWRWLSDQEERPDVARAASHVLDAVLAKNATALKSARTELYKAAELALDHELARAEREREAGAALSAALGGDHRLADLREIAYLLPSAFEFLGMQDAFARPLARLDQDGLFEARKRFIALRSVRPHHGPYFLVMLANRFEKPWHALAVAKALSDARDPALAEAADDIAVIEGSLFERLEGMARALGRDAERAIDADAAFRSIDVYVELAEGILAEAAAGGDEPLRRRTLACRDVAADAFERMLERALATVRRALPLRKAGGSARLAGARPDLAADIEEEDRLAAEESVRLLEESFDSARALDRDGVLRDTRTHAQRAVRGYVEDVVAEIRAADDADRTRGRNRVETVLGFGGRLLDEDEVELLRRRARAAAEEAA